MRNRRWHLLIIAFVALCGLLSAIWVGNSFNKRLGQLESQPNKALLERDYLSKIANKEEFEMGYGPSRIQTPCIDSHISRVKTKEISTWEVHVACSSELRKLFRKKKFKLTDSDLFAITVTVVANRLAPYGFSKAQTYEDIISSAYLNCSQHSLFVDEQVQRYGSRDAILTRLGIDGGHIGNYALVFYERSDVKMLLDGTTATVAFVGLDEVLDGVLVSTYNIYDFYTDTDEAIEIFRRKIRGALRLGAIRPKHVIYRISSNLKANGGQVSK